MHSNMTITVFFLTILITFGIAILGGKYSKENNEDDLANRSLNKWLIGLSGGSTANSGFIVSGAVGLGYLYGLQWVLLPLAWLLGDLIFWRFFPEKINIISRQNNSMTLSDILVFGLKGKAVKFIKVTIALIMCFGLGTYTIAQWTAGQKFLEGALEFQATSSLFLFGGLIVAYSAIGGFRGSVYVDTFQALLRLLGTTLIMGFAVFYIYADYESFSNIMGSQPDQFFNLFGSMGIASSLAFILGWASASLGFGLGQPQMTMRFMSAKTPLELKKAKWIYIGYVQVTWISMTIFGVLLKGIQPDIADPEAGLAIFIAFAMPSILAGIILADIFGVIASTANSLLVALTHTIRHDLLQGSKRFPAALLTLIFGVITMLVALSSNQTVASLAISSISLIAASIAGSVIIKLLNIKHTAGSLLFSIIIAAFSSIAWSVSSLSGYINEAFIGVVIALVTNYLVCQTRNSDSKV